MQRNYISPEIKIQRFSDTVQTIEGEPTTTSAINMAHQYFDNFEIDQQKVREVLTMKK